MVIPLMLATLTDRRDFGGDWLLERKFDGERCVARKAGNEVRLESRSGKDLSSTYPEVTAAVAGQPSRDLLLDGEVVAYDGDQTSFTRLQQRLGSSAPSEQQVATYPVVYCVFDLLEIDGEDLRDQPLVDRRARLTSTITLDSALQHAEAWRGRLTAALRGSVPTWLGRTHCETGQCPVRLWPFERLVEAEVCLGAGVRNRRLHRSDRQQDGLWCAPRRLLRARLSPLRRKGRHRFHQGRHSMNLGSG